VPEITALITAASLLFGGVFALRKWKGEKTSEVVSQQSTLLTDMRTLYETLEATTARMRADAVLTQADLVAAHVVIGQLKERVAELEADIEERLRANGETA